MLTNRSLIVQFAYSSFEPQNSNFQGDVRETVDNKRFEELWANWQIYQRVRSQCADFDRAENSRNKMSRVVATYPVPNSYGSTEVRQSTDAYSWFTSLIKLISCLVPGRLEEYGKI